MATSPIFTFGESLSFDIEKRLSDSGRISLSDIVAASIGTLDSEETSSNVDYINDAGNSGYDIDDTSSKSTASFEVPDQSKVLFHHESSRDSFHSFNIEESSRLFTFGASLSFDIERKLSESGRISLTDIVAASIGTLDSEEKSSNVDFINDAGNSGYDIDDTSSKSTASFEVPDQSKVLFHHESSRDSFNSCNIEEPSSLTDDSYDSDLEEACTFNDPVDLLDHLSPETGTGMIPSTLKYPPSLDSTPSTSICENQHKSSFTGLLHLLSDTAPLNNPLFEDLLAALLDECKMDVMPTTLIDMCTRDSTVDVHARERAIERKFDHLDESPLQMTNQLSEILRCEFQLNKTEPPIKVLHESDYSCRNSDSVKSRFDLDLHKMMNPVEKSGNLLDEAAKGNNNNRYAPYIPRQRPMLSRRAVRMMEEWYARNYEHPYPNSFAVEAFTKAGGITNQQVKKWFANKRNRCKNTRRVPDTERNLYGKY